MKRKAKGEITTQVATSDSNYKSINRTFIIPLEVEEIDPLQQLSCGLHQEHLSGGNSEVKVTMNSGAGCGSRWIFGSYKKGKSERCYRVDAEQLLNRVIEGLDREHPALAPGDHVKFTFCAEDGEMKGIVLRVYQNDGHDWCDIWSPDESRDSGGSRFSLPAQDKEFGRSVERIPGPRG